MPKVLTQEQIDHYHTEGFYSPLDVMPQDRCNEILAAVDRFEDEYGVNPGVFKLKGHLTMEETWDLLHEPAILDIVEDLIGPNILAFGSRFWVKPHDDGSFVSWHQDSAYFGCTPHDMVTLWLALTPATKENGCMRMMPRSHHEGFDHDESHENAPGDAPGEKKNLLGRGQTIPDMDEDKAVYTPLKQGQASLHNERTAHASGPNFTDGPRIGYSFFFIPPHVKSTLERRPATLVRGVDEYNHWDPDPHPTKDKMPELIEMMLEHNAQYTNPKFRQSA